MSKHTPAVQVTLADWCKLCDALSMQPESTIVDVLQKVNRLSRLISASPDLHGLKCGDTISFKAENVYDIYPE